MLLKQWNEDFINKMKNRIRIGHFRYDTLNNVRCFDRITFCFQKIYNYLETHNTEYLVDAANMLMLEYDAPSFIDAYFESDNSEINSVRTHIEV